VHAASPPSARESTARAWPATRGPRCSPRRRRPIRHSSHTSRRCSTSTVVAATRRSRLMRRAAPSDARVWYARRAPATSRLWKCWIASPKTIPTGGVRVERGIGHELRLTQGIRVALDVIH
jgi:hypothetical protein